MCTLNATREIRILLVDDHPALRRGLTTIIHDCPDMKVIAEAGSGEQAIAQFRTHRPDVTLMDLRMNGMSGAEATAAIRREFPDARVIMLTTYEGDADIHRAIAVGARGYLLKSMLPEQQMAAIRRVHAGRRAIPDEVAAQLADHFAFEHLSAREIEILDLAAGGRRNKQIGEQLGVSEDTIKTHMSSILAKLDASDRTHAVAIAMRRGIIRL
jgi:two-component system, NarL family, response regulator